MEWNTVVGQAIVVAGLFVATEVWLVYTVVGRLKQMEEEDRER